MKRIYRLLLYIPILYFISCNEQRKDIDSDKKEIGFIHQNSKYQILIDTGIIEIEEKLLFQDYFGQPYLCIDSLLFPLFPDKHTSISAFPYSHMPEQICCFENGDVYFIEDPFLQRITNGNIEKILPLSYDIRNISKAGESGIYFYGINETDKICDLFFIDKKNDFIIKLLSDTLKINAVLGTGYTTMVGMDSIVYLLNEEGMFPIFNAKNEITSLCDNEVGIFYATRYNIGLFNNEGKSLTFMNFGAKKLLSKQDTLYILDDIGRFSRITGTNYFNNILDSIP